MEYLLKCIKNGNEEEINHLHIDVTHEDVIEKLNNLSEEDLNSLVPYMCGELTFELKSSIIHYLIGDIWIINAAMIKTTDLYSFHLQYVLEEINSAIKWGRELPEETNHYYLFNHIKRFHPDAVEILFWSGFEALERDGVIKYTKNEKIRYKRYKKDDENNYNIYLKLKEYQDGIDY